MSYHPDPRHLVQLARGRLGKNRTERVLNHCRSCEPCGDQLAAVLVMRDGMPRAALRSVARPLATAAGLILAAGLAVVFALNGMNGEAVPGAPRLAVSQTSALATDEPPGDWLAQLRFSSLFTVANDSQQASEALLKSGFMALTEDRISDALRDLTAYRELHPGDLESAVYLGVAHYLNGTNSAARLLLEEGREIDEDYLRNMADWYLANLLLREGDLVAAEALLSRLIEEHDDFATSAEQLSQALTDR